MRWCFRWLSLKEKQVRTKCVLKCVLKCEGRGRELINLSSRIDEYHPESMTGDSLTHLQGAKGVRQSMEWEISPTISLANGKVLEKVP